jgi:outer membrane protein assembly factor BamB
VAAGHYLFTQEQRGEQETTVCYDAQTGKQVWEYAIPARFFEGLGGLGPRATPTFANGFVYSLGAEGLLTKLDARTGKLVWEANVQTEAGRSGPPMWGYSASPLVEQGLVVVHAGGKDSKGILAFDDETGKLRWSAPAGENSYASVQVIEALGEKHLALLSDLGAHLLDPQTGAVVFDYAWPHVGYRALQPQVIGGDKLLIPTGLGTGTRLVQLAKVDGKLTAKELWTSLDLKSDFNDAVVYENHLYGFDNAIFTCLDLATGERNWKGGRYEKGQALLLADSGLILVVSERGALVLLRATPERHEELAKIPALDGKTWNHPIVVGDRLYLRNSEEAVCYELATP